MVEGHTPATRGVSTFGALVQAEVMALTWAVGQDVLVAGAVAGLAGAVTGLAGAVAGLAGEVVRPPEGVAWAAEEVVRAAEELWQQKRRLP